MLTRPVILLSVFVFATSAHAATLTFTVPAGKLIVQVDHPDVAVSLDGEELRIVGAGQGDVRLKTGPYLFRQSPDPRARGVEVLSLRKDDRIVVRVVAQALVHAEADQAERSDNSERFRVMSREHAGQLVQLRNSLDERVWQQVSSRYTTTEAAKLLITFFRGDGRLPEFVGELTGAEQLRADLNGLRHAREEAFTMLTRVARYEQQHDAPPIVGTWDITLISGAGGIAADALELYDPDPIKRRFVATRETAALLTGAGFWLFDTEYSGDAANNTSGNVDLSVVVRGNSVYHGLYAIDGDIARLAVAPMNRPRPKKSNDTPTDGGFVLTLKRAGPR